MNSITQPQRENETEHYKGRAKGTEHDKGVTKLNTSQRYRGNETEYKFITQVDGIRKRIATHQCDNETEYNTT